MAKDIKDLKKTQPNFRKLCEPERDVLIEQFKGVLRWKRVIEWGLGVVFVGFVGALIKFLAG